MKTTTRKRRKNLVIQQSSGVPSRGIDEHTFAYAVMTRDEIRYVPHGGPWNDPQITWEQRRNAAAWAKRDAQLGIGQLKGNIK